MTKEGVVFLFFALFMCGFAFKCAQKINEEDAANHERLTKCEKACYPNVVARCFDDKVICNYESFYKEIK